MNFSYTELDNFETLEVSLPRVSKVTFEVKRCEVESLHTLFGVLAFSQVKELDLVLDLDNLEDMHVWLSFLSTFMKNFAMETVSHLSLEVRSKTESRLLQVCGDYDLDDSHRTSRICTLDRSGKAVEVPGT